MEATLSFDADVAVQSVQALFDLSGTNTGTRMTDVFPDGNRFAITEPQGVTAANAITVVANFSQLPSGSGRR